MSNFNVIAPVALICRGVGMKTALIAAVAVIIAIAAALIGGGLHSDAYADSPTETRASQSSDDASQALFRYTLELLHILSNADANRWERYRQAMPHCAAAPSRLAEVGANGDSNQFDAALIALTQDLCADLDQRLEEARTVGLLVNEPDAMDGYVLIAGILNHYVHLIDRLGRIAHSWHVENRLRYAKLLDNGNLLADAVRMSGDKIVVEVDPDGNIVWEYYTHPDRLHHDFLKMPNGNVLMIAEGIKTREEAIEAGANPSFVPMGGMKYDYLIEVRPTGSEGGEIVWKWSTWDYIAQDFDPTKENYGDPSEHPELIDVNLLFGEVQSSDYVWNWLHINAIDYNPALDQIMLSPRQYNELWIIDRSASTEVAPTRAGGNAGKGGALLYRWGNPRSYGHGTAADRRLFLPHNAQWIAPGLPGEDNILVFNNGWAHERGQSRKYSSIDEIVPPLNGYSYRREPGAPYPPADPIWTYTAETPTDFNSYIMGCVQRLPNGNTLICDSTSGNLFQATPEGKTVWQYVYPMDVDAPLKQGGQASVWRSRAQIGDTLFTNAVYRAYWYAPDHPGLQNYDLTPGGTIELYE